MVRETSEPTSHPSEGHVVLPARQFNPNYEMDPLDEIPTIPSSVKEDEIPNILHRFEIPSDIDIIIPHPWQTMYNCPDGCICIHLAAFECGFRVPILEEIRAILVRLDMSPTQLLPNALGLLSVFFVIMKMEGEPCTPDNFLRAFTVSTSPANKHFFCFQPRRGYRMLHSFTSSYGLQWWPRYVYLKMPLTSEGRIQPWGVPLKWRKRKFENEPLREPIPVWMTRYHKLDSEQY